MFKKLLFLAVSLLLLALGGTLQAQSASEEERLFLINSAD